MISDNFRRESPMKDVEPYDPGRYNAGPLAELKTWIPLLAKPSLLSYLPGFLHSVKKPDSDSSCLLYELVGVLYKIILFQLVTRVPAISTPGIVCALFKI